MADVELCRLPAHTALLLQQCRQRACTVNAALGAALLHATAVVLREATGGGGVLGFSLALLCAADTRRLHAPPIPPHVLSDLASGITPFITQLAPVCFAI